MSTKPSWMRSIAAVFAWAAVTAVAAAGSWLGMTTALTGEPSTASAATVVTTEAESSPSPTQSSSPRTRSDPERSKKPDPPADRNGWSAVGTDTYERVFQTGGGSAVIQLGPDEAAFVSASPAEGYTARKEWPAANHLVVTFFSSRSMVTIVTMWRDGEPQAHVSEI